MPRATTPTAARWASTAWWTGTITSSWGDCTATRRRTHTPSAATSPGTFRISDLKAKTFSYDIDADGGQKASTLVYYTDEGADPVLFQQTDGDWRLASDNFLAENAIVEDLEQAYTGEISPVYLNRDIVDMEEMAEAYGWVRPEGTPASIAAVARKAAASSAAEKPSPGKVADAAREVSKDSAPRR